MNLKGLVEDIRRDGACVVAHGLAYRVTRKVAPYRAIYGARLAAYGWFATSAVEELYLHFDPT